MRSKMIFALACAGLFACGGAASPAAQAVASPGAQSGPPNGAPNAAAPGTIRRTDVDALVCGGFGAFLQTLIIDEHPVFMGGKFHGFRLVDLAPAWRTSGIRAGDVVTRVNGMPIERPEQALEVFRSLTVASELHVDFERDGEPHEVRYAIDDDRPSGAGACPSDAPRAAAPPAAGAPTSSPASAPAPAPAAAPPVSPAVSPAAPAAPPSAAPVKPVKPAKPAKSTPATKK